MLLMISPFVMISKYPVKNNSITYIKITNGKIFIKNMTDQSNKIKSIKYKGKSILKPKRDPNSFFYIRRK
jgi:hypothetical protein